MDDPFVPCTRGCCTPANGHRFGPDLRCENPRRFILASVRGQIYSSDLALLYPRVCHREYASHVKNPTPCHHNNPEIDTREAIGRDAKMARKYTSRRKYNERMGY